MGGVLWAPLPTVRLLMLFVLLSLLACPALPFRGPVLVTDSEWWGRSVSAPQGRTTVWVRRHVIVFSLCSTGASGAQRKRRPMWKGFPEQRRPRGRFRWPLRSVHETNTQESVSFGPPFDPCRTALWVGFPG